MILVTGATGAFGSAAISHLLNKGVSSKEISALVRDEAKAQDLLSKGIQLKIGDYDNYSSLVKAFDGVDQLLFVSGSDVEKRGAQHENVVNAAKESGVKHIYYTSFERKNETETSPIALLAKSHIDTENQIKESGITYTIFRNNLYFDVLPMFLGNQVTETCVYFPAGNAKSGFALRDELAEAAVNVLTTTGHENKEYFFSNPESVGMHKIAETLSEITGTPISYTDPEPNVYYDNLIKANVPEMYAQMSAGFAQAIKEGEFSSDQSDLERFLGRKPSTSKEFLASVYGNK